MPKESEHVAADGTVRKDHYGPGRQPWDDILDAGWGAPFAAGNALKYVRRHKAKNGADDLEKGRWYFAELLKMVAAERQKRLVMNTMFPIAVSVVYEQLLSLLSAEELSLLSGQP